MSQKTFTPLFVYGTLRKRHGNHPLLAEVNAEYIGNGRLPRGYILIVHRGLPAVAELHEDFRGAKINRVFGELYMLPGDGDGEAMRVIDLLESAYVRESLVVEREDGSTIRAWTYGAFPGSPILDLFKHWAHKDEVEHVESGDYDRWFFDRRIDAEARG